MDDEKKKITVEVVMIVRNESALLGRALESVKDADFITVVDTGSDDGGATVAIARKYTNKVYENEYVWNDNFAEARNFALSKAEGSWVLSLDADEFCQDFSEVRRVVELGDQAIRVTMCGEGRTDLEFTFARLFKNCPEIYWVEPVHNHLNVSGEGERIGDVRITFGWSPAHDKDLNRAMRILEKAVKEDPTPRRLYYLGREYWYKQEYEKCVIALGRQVRTDLWPAQRADGFMVMSMAFSKLGQDQDARDACAQAIMINSDFKEAIEWMANISTDQNAPQWRRMAQTASNRDLLIVRSPANQ